MKPAPCQPDCTERNATCHSVCPRYAEWRAAKDAENEQKNKIKKAERDYWGHRVDYIQKCKKKRFPK